MKRMPLTPMLGPLPSMRMLRRTTFRPVPDVMFTMIPLTPEERMLASVPFPSSVIGFVMVTAPNPPGSSASMMPPEAVFEIAPAHVLHGAVRLHGLTSSPTPETHVRVAWPCAANAATKIMRTKKPRRNLVVCILLPPC